MNMKEIMEEEMTPVIDKSPLSSSNGEIFFKDPNIKMLLSAL